MKQFYILIFPIIFVFNSTAQNTDEETKYVNEIINYFVDRDSTLLDKTIQVVDGFNSGIQATPEWHIHEDVFSKLENHFDLADSTYYFKEIEKRKNVKLILNQDKNVYKYINKKKIDDFIIKVEEDYIKGIKNDFYQDFENKIGVIQEFGLPIISKDGKYLLLRKLRMGPGKKNSVFLKLYEKSNEDWIYIKTVFELDQ